MSDPQPQPSVALLKIINTPTSQSVAYYILMVGKCAFLMGMCLYIARVYYNWKQRMVAVSKLFFVYFLAGTVMVFYELIFHQIMTIYYCVLVASFGQVVGIRINLSRVAKY